MIERKMLPLYQHGDFFAYRPQKARSLQLQRDPKTGRLLPSNSGRPGRPGGITKIKTSQLINRLTNHAFGSVELQPSQVRGLDHRRE